MNEKLVVEKLIQRGETISSMESCTGGYFASTITCVSGSSKVLEFSAVTYSNEYKIKMGVNRTTIDMYSVYSSEVAREMAKCISEFSKSSYGVGITGKINEVDPNNLVGANNIVYVSIYCARDNNFIDMELVVPSDSRKKVKEFIVDNILKKVIVDYFKSIC